jgi:hypothetical protein
MKVPYLNRRIDKEFRFYLNEFEASTKLGLNINRSSPDAKNFFSGLFPLFVLVRGLVNSEYVRNPARDAILSELRVPGRKQDFLKAIVKFNRRQPYQDELLAGLQKQTFTGHFEELFSDTLLLLNSFCTYNYRGALIAVRCMLEDLYRHLYYRDHPQEFWALRQESEWDEMALGITPKKLRDGLRSTEYLSVFFGLNANFEKKDKESDDDLFGLNDRLYGQCSRFVHGSSGSSLSAFKANADLVPNAERAEMVAKVAREFVGMAVAFLISAHIDHFMAFGEYERSMVLDAFGQGRRAAFRRALNV